MIILSHRGCPRSPEEGNSEAALERSFAAGFGAETDVRDLAGRLVISHDPPTGGELSLSRLLQLHARYAGGPTLPLALNIKSDGLADRMADELKQCPVRDWFAFDMSVPDIAGYRDRQLPFFTRHSEEEPTPAFYGPAVGVWLDGLRSDWFGDAVIDGHLAAGKRVCAVSPELHGRDHRTLWSRLAARGRDEDRMMICTDYPTEATALLGGR